MAMPPILVADLFPEVTSRLLELLRSLSPDEWHLPTVSSRRTVKDVTKRRSREASLRQFPAIRITGDEALGLHVLDMVSVMA